MKRRVGYGNPIVVFVLGVVFGAVYPLIAEPKPPNLPERPYFTFFVSRIDRLLDRCRTVYDAVDRPDLSESLGDRLKSYRDFAGIVKSKPLGIMSTWDETAPSSVVFLPVDQIDDLLKTATFGVLGFHQVNPGQFEIERPGSPYHVLVRKDYALFADSLATIRALRATPEQQTQGLRDRYDVALILDLLQIPRPVKERFVTEIRGQAEPWLQPRDEEMTESANLRKGIGKAILNLVERGLLDTKLVTIGFKLNPDSKHLILEIAVEAVSKSNLATGLNNLASYRSEFSSLLQPDVPAGIAINLPLGGLIERILDPNDESSAKASRLEAGLQLTGSGVGDFTIIAALHGPGADRINDVIPELILNLEKSGSFAAVQENFDIHRSIVLHRIRPREMPDWISQWVGPEIEILVGQGKQIVWLGIGSSKTLVERVSTAIDLVDETPSIPEKGRLLRARFQASKLPEVIESTPLVPKSGTDATRAELEKGEDGFHMTLEPIRDGLRLRLEAEEGFLRLFGRDWVKQLEIAKPN